MNIHSVGVHDCAFHMTSAGFSDDEDDDDVNSAEGGI
jgi:hypothetical protein